jgi:hypothetical protein
MIKSAERTSTFERKNVGRLFYDTQAGRIAPLIRADCALISLGKEPAAHARPNARDRFRNRFHNFARASLFLLNDPKRNSLGASRSYPWHAAELSNQLLD